MHHEQRAQAFSIGCSTTVFVCSVVYVHDLTRHRALTSLHADTCGFVRGGFLFCLWKRVLAAVSSCSCLWQDFVIARNVSLNLLHVCLCTSHNVTLKKV